MKVYEIGGGYRLRLETKLDPFTEYKVLEFPYSDETGGPVTAMVGVTHAGMLQCNVHSGDDWCAHIEMVLKDNADTYLIWGPPDSEPDDLTDKHMMVPLIPSHDIWAGVYMGHRTPSGAHKVHYRGDGPGRSSGAEGPFIGFFEPGEGRNVLRSMIYDWFRTEIALGNVLECRAKSHGFKAQMEYAASIAVGGTRLFAEHWSVFTNGRCITCAGPQKAIDGIFDDLVPDDSKPPSPWAKGGIV